MLPRYWGAYKSQNVRNGSLSQNGCGRFADIDDASLSYIRSLGCTHVWFTGIIDHATSYTAEGIVPSHPQFVKGKAGSPYAIRDYYKVAPYLGTSPAAAMNEFEQLVERSHRAGLKVIMDLVPNHVSRDNVNFGTDDDKSVHWKAENDFFYYPGQSLTLPVAFVPDGYWSEAYAEYPARATGNNCFNASPTVNDWYETVKLNICDFHTPTWDRFLDILMFWASKGVDGFRFDMVELVPEQFMQWLIASVKKQHPDMIFIGEVYSMDKYRRYIREVGFDYLYDKSGLYDLLHEILMRNVADNYSPMELWQSTKRITSNWQKLGDLQPNMLNFLENHDELRIASAQYTGDASFTWAALAVSALLNTAPFMLYYGQEVGERGAYDEGFSSGDGRSTIFDWWSIESVAALYRHIHDGSPLSDKAEYVLGRYRELLTLASEPAFAKGQIYDLCYCNMSSAGFDPDRHFAFLRYNADICYLVFANFSAKDARACINIPMRETSVEVTAAAHDFTVIKL